MEYRSILKKISRKDGKDKIPGHKEFLCVPGETLASLRENKMANSDLEVQECESSTGRSEGNGV